MELAAAVEEEDGKECVPDGTVEAHDPHKLPFVRYPTPQCCGPVYVPVVTIAEEEEDESWDRRDAVACADVRELEVFEALCGVLFEHSEIDIQGHGETLQ